MDDKPGWFEFHATVRAAQPEPEEVKQARSKAQRKIQRWLDQGHVIFGDTGLELRVGNGEGK